MILLVTVFLVSNAAATAFGSFTFETDKFSEDLNATYSIGLANPGNETVEVELDYEESENYNVTFDETSFEMNGTEVTSSPKSSGSIYLGDGRYAEVKEVELVLEASRYRESNQIEFPVTVQASTVNQSEGTQETVYIQEHWLELEIEPSLVPEERDEEPETSFWEGVTGQESEEPEDSEEETDQEASDEEEFNTEQDETETRNENQVQQNENQTGQSLEDSEESQVDTVTYVLLFGLLLSLTYLYRVA